MAPVVVHHLNQSRSLRVLWLLEELGVEYSITTYERNPKTLRAPPALREAHPLGKAPVVEIEGRTYAETGVIIEALCDRFDADHRLRPSPDDIDAFENYRFFLHYSEGSLMPPLLVALITRRLRTAPLPFFIKPVVKRIAGRLDASFTNGELELHGQFVEQHLASHAYFAGDAFSAADVVMQYAVEGGLARGMFGAGHPSTRAWFERVKARDAYRRAVERGGESELSL
ncbi:MAG: glutathione S-transferase [Myxococcota bacterium]